MALVLALLVAGGVWLLVAIPVALLLGAAIHLAEQGGPR